MGKQLELQYCLKGHRTLNSLPTSLKNDFKTINYSKVSKQLKPQSLFIRYMQTRGSSS